ncbi:DNA polymerase III subunit delta' [Primorskyibacter marinus]|uniref:DNA polymerase III subunit delta' n=1 Tax=Primorskyibacter marinus TaxID=1977320 RepID=UPI000E302312|nr:DNA polymerase III subunit delta' [Primorskyibacter marinus]
MSDDTLPESDRAPGAPHPRETPKVIGQDAAKAAFLEAFNSGRLHHAWLITGPRGVGKATLAWTIARFLLATPMPQSEGGAGLFGDALPDAAPQTLDIGPEHPVSRRILAMSEPGLFLLRRPYDEKSKRLKTQITVDEVRRLKGFFSLSAVDGGRRVVIIDTADEMNVSAANAVLKLLEEPPADTTLLLISHQPSHLLPTIRSRCRELRLGSLDTQGMAHALALAGIETETANTAALAELSAGSVGEAIRLVNLNGLALYDEIISLLGSLPDLDRTRAIRLGESAAGRTAEDRYALMLGLLDLALARVARTGATGQPPVIEAAPNEAGILTRLAPSPRAARAWAESAQTVGARLRHGRAVNLDPAALILDTLLKLRSTAADLARQHG